MPKLLLYLFAMEALQ